MATRVILVNLLGLVWFLMKAHAIFGGVREFVLSETAYRLTLCGRVQGVGLRPFVYHLAQKYQIFGWVKNTTGHVHLHIEGDSKNLLNFIDELSQVPSPAKASIRDQQLVPSEAHTSFEIRLSSNVIDDIHLLPDIAPCELCLSELFEPSHRLYHYPFINCSRCGPRYTLLQNLPYDRCNTSMQKFVLCELCHAEYTIATNRRFHAEPIACDACGPRLNYRAGTQQIVGNDESMAAAIEAIGDGKIIAVKGVGGFHLMCDASNPEVIQRLRQRKGRPHKPLAIMGFESHLSEWVELQDIHLQTLRSSAKPIVLAQLKCDLLGMKLSIKLPLKSKIKNTDLAPALNELGVMLPYSPLHYLLLNALDRPLVATSANISGEPVLTDNSAVEQRLAHIADAFLLHDRDILHSADDSVYRLIAGKMRPFRLGRGNAPLEFTLPFTLDESLLAMGGQMKNSFSLAWQKRVIISPHIGNLDSLRAQECQEKSIADLSQLYHVTPKKIVMDAHPAFSYRRWVKTSNLPVHEIQHHFAHASQLAGEYPNVSRWLVFTWDGMGLGTDKSLWGGEALLGQAGQWQRQASIRQFRLTGGDRVAKQPWRSAAALCWEAGLTYQPPDNNPMHFQAWKKGINTYQCSSIGRLFDGASALLSLGDESSYEGQGPMVLEALAGDTKAFSLDLTIDFITDENQQGIWRTDWSPLLLMLKNEQFTTTERAAIFHETLAQLLVQQALLIRKSEGDFVVGLSGGVFQNKRLSESVFQRLQTLGFQAYLPSKIPMNDAGLAYGQLIEYHALRIK